MQWSSGASEQPHARVAFCGGGIPNIRFISPVQIETNKRVVCQIEGIVPRPRRKASPSPGSVKTDVPLRLLLMSHVLIFMKLHGKLLIWARNESAEPDRLMNIHP